MALPKPVQGLVIRYSYLWHSERALGREDGSKDRPCAVVLVTRGAADQAIVTVLPITHSPPDDLRLAVEIPPTTKTRMGLDFERSWVILSEANRFRWPGPDLRPRSGNDMSSVAYGLLPYRLMDEIRLKLVGVFKARRSTVVSRVE